MPASTRNSAAAALLSKTLLVVKLIRRQTHTIEAKVHGLDKAIVDAWLEDGVEHCQRRSQEFSEDLRALVMCSRRTILDHRGHAQEFKMAVDGKAGISAALQVWYALPTKFSVLLVICVFALLLLQ